MDELTIAFKIESPPSWLPIGRTAENNWRTVEIDCSYWFNMNANGEVVLMYKPSCGMTPYPLLTERDGDNIIWRPKSGELVEGVGRLQAFFEVGTDVIGSSDMISCEVDSSLLGVDPGTDPGQTDLPWALDIIEQIAELSGHYPKIIDGDLYIWDSTLNDWVEFEASAVDSVNGKKGVVVLDASDVGALPDSTVIPPTVTEQTVAGWGFTKNTGTYSKPSGGIPASDLASAVQTSLGKADTAVQPSAISGMATETWVENKGYQTAPFEIQITQSGSTYSTTATAQEILDNADNCIAVLPGGAKTPKPDVVFRSSQTAVTILFTVGAVFNGYLDATQITVAVANGTVVVAISAAHLDPLPSVTASDNGKFLCVVNGAWAKKAYDGGSSVTVDSALSTTSTNPVQNKVVKASLDGKADAKATGDAISALDAQVIASMPHDTVSGSIASFPDGAAMPVIDCSVAVAPNQDLHGYDSPWPAGGGKNLYNASIITGQGSAGNNGVVCTVSNGVINLNGTATSNAYFSANGLHLPSGNYAISANNPIGTDGVHIALMDENGNYYSDSGLSQANHKALVSSRDINTVIIYVKQGTQLTNFKLQPQVEVGTAATSWTPYSNICPITGWTGANVTRTGKNLLDVESRTITTNWSEQSIYSIYPEGCTVTKNNDVVSATATGAWSKIRLYNSAQHFKHGNTYTISAYFDNPSGNRVGIGYLKLGISTSQWTTSNTVRTSGKVSFSLTYDDSWGDIVISFIVNNTASPTNTIVTVSEMMIELGSTASAYESYIAPTTASLSWQTSAGTVYGGTLDVTTGKLTVDRAGVDLGTLTWEGQYTGSTNKTILSHLPSMLPHRQQRIVLAENYQYFGIVGATSQLSDPDNLAVGLRTYYQPNYAEYDNLIYAVLPIGDMPAGSVVYPLATPIEYTLTPTEVTTLLGTNNIWADAGDTTVNYYADTTLFVNKKIAAAVAVMS